MSDMQDFEVVIEIKKVVLHKISVSASSLMEAFDSARQLAANLTQEDDTRHTYSVFKIQKKEE